MPRRAGPAVLALAALLAAAACGDERTDVPAGAGAAAPAAPADPQLLTLAELQAAVKRNLQRGALVSFWATW
jgi:hypothetical protein